MNQVKPDEEVLSGKYRLSVTSRIPYPFHSQHHFTESFVSTIAELNDASVKRERGSLVLSVDVSLNPLFRQKFLNDASNCIPRSPGIHPEEAFSLCEQVLD